MKTEKQKLVDEVRKNRTKIRALLYQLTNKELIYIIAEIEILKWNRKN